MTASSPEPSASEHGTMSADLPPALSANDVLRMARGYLARRAASTEQMRRYLLRKARRRNFERHGSSEDTTAVHPVVEDVLGRLDRAGLLNDVALALSRRSDLIAKGLPAKRVKRTLQMQGLETAFDPLTPAACIEDETQALRYAERKRLGRFASGRRLPSTERDIRALVRAGFALDLAVRVMRDLMPEPSVSVDETDPAFR